MADRIDDLTQDNVCKNVLGDTPDLKGNRDITHNANAVRSNNGVYYPSNASGSFLNTAGDFFDIAGNGQFSFWIKFRLRAVFNPTAIFTPVGATSVRAPSLEYSSLSKILTLGLRGQGSGPSVSWNLSAQTPTHLLEEEIVVGSSWNPTGNVLLATKLKTLSGKSVNASIISAGSAPQAAAQLLGTSLFGTADNYIYKLGVIIGEAVGQDDLDDTQINILQPILNLAQGGSLYKDDN